MASAKAQECHSCALLQAMTAIAITQHYSLKALPLPMTEDGPNMDVVRSSLTALLKRNLVAYRVLQTLPVLPIQMRACPLKFANLKPYVAPDFRICWDNLRNSAPLYQNLRPPQLLNIFDTCRVAADDAQRT